MKKLLCCLALATTPGLALAGSAQSLAGPAPAQPPTPTGPATTIAGTSSGIHGAAWRAPAQRTNPTVSAIGPASAPNDIDTPVTISGADFAAVMDGSGAVVLTPPTASLGGTALTNLAFVNSSTLTATVPWGMDPGTYTLTVTNPDGASGSLGSAFTVARGIGKWNSGDLFGGEVRQVLLKPGEPDTVYALAYEVGLFRSRDAGEHWSFVSGNVIGNADFAIDPLHATWLYSYQYGDAAHTGLFRSTDEGDMWARIMAGKWPDGRAIGCGEVYPSPHDAQVLFVRSVVDYLPSGQGRVSRDTDARASTGTAVGLIKSADGGTSWHVVPGMDGIPVQDVAFSPSDASKVVLATQDGRVLLSTNSGDTWSEVARPPLSSIGMITFNPYDPTEVWILSTRAPTKPAAPDAIYKSADAAFSSWLDVSPAAGVGASTIAFTGAESVYINRYHSTDGGLSWQGFGPWPWYGDGAVCFDPRDPQVGYIGEGAYAVQKTIDGGQTWQIKNQGLTGMRCSSLDVSQADPLRVYAAFGDWPGVYRSEDGTNSWAYLPFAGSNNAGWIYEDPFDSQRVYMAAHSAFYVSTDGGQQWSDLGWNGTPSSMTGMPWALAPDPHNAGHLLVSFVNGPFPSGPTRLFGSNDYGVSWHALSLPQDVAWIGGIAFDPETPGSIYVTTQGTGIYRSTDDGASWERIDDPTQPYMLMAKGITIAMHPQHVVFVHAEDGPYRSLDHGATWQRADVPDNSGMTDFMFVDEDSTRLYAGMWSGLWYSSDLGSSWKRAAGAIGRLHITALGYGAAQDRAILYAATCGGEVTSTSTRGSTSAQSFLAKRRKLVGAGVYRYAVVAPRLKVKLGGLRSGALKLHKRLTAKGVATPTCLAGSKVVLKLQKKARKWVTVKTARCVIRGNGAFRWKYRPGKKGAYRLQATIAKTATNTAVQTKWCRFKVR